ncbi:MULTISPECIES: hypothetical protein [Eikenella]|nr:MULTISPECIES: hypothetical protein [Eikenella]
MNLKLRLVSRATPAALNEAEGYLKLDRLPEKYFRPFITPFFR